jgi:hypothetical protein
MNTRHYRPGFRERIKRAVRDGLQWLGWKAAKVLSIMSLGVILFQNSDKIGEAAKDKLSEIFNGRSQVESAHADIVANAPPPVTGTQKKENMDRDREGMIMEELTPSPALPSSPQVRKKISQPSRLNTGIESPLDRPVKYFSGENFKKTGDMKLRARIEKYTRNDPISFTLVDRVYGSESGYKNSSVSSTGARGLVQMIPSTQLEYMYKFKHLLPQKAAEAAEHIKFERGFYKVEGVSEASVLNHIWDERVSRVLGQEFIRNVAQTLKETLRAKLQHDIREVERTYNGPDKQARLTEMRHHLARPLNFTDIKFGYVLGPGNPKKPEDPGGAANLLAAYADPYIRNQHHRASDYVSKAAAEANPTLFVSRSPIITGKDEKAKLKNVWSHSYDLAQSYNHVSSYMGPDILPDDVSRPGQKLTGKNSHPSDPHIS